MAATKLTLSADKDIVKKAKELAKAEGTSLSSMFSRYLDAVLKGPRMVGQPGPLTLKATGLVKLPANKDDRAILEEALAAKFGRR